MAEFGEIPLRLNGVPIPAAGDISIQMSRNVSQKPTTDGYKIVYGRPKWQATLTFPTLASRISFMQAIGAYDERPATHDLGFDLADQSFSLLRGIPSSLQPTSDQDGQVSLQIAMMYEEFQYEGAVLDGVTG